MDLITQVIKATHQERLEIDGIDLPFTHKYDFDVRHLNHNYIIIIEKKIEKK
jgi:hypothetical protein